MHDCGMVVQKQTQNAVQIIAEENVRLHKFAVVRIEITI